MGHSCHNSTVTDFEQKVLNVRGLRVADVSLSPAIGRSNGMSSDALFGEKLADVLRHRWDKHYVSIYKKKKSAINVVLDSSWIYRTKIYIVIPKRYFVWLVKQFFEYKLHKLCAIIELDLIFIIDKKNHF